MKEIKDLRRARLGVAGERNHSRVLHMVKGRRKRRAHEKPLSPHVGMVYRKSILEVEST